MPLDIRNKNLAITFPQCPLGKEHIIGALLDIIESKGKALPLYYTGCNETHEDGSLHSHILLTFDYVLRIQTPSFFDIIDGDSTYHPNIQAARANGRDFYNYCFKEDTDVLSTHPSDFGDKTQKTSRDERLLEIAETASSRSEYLSEMHKHDTGRFMYGLRHLQEYAKWRFPDEAVPEYVSPYENFVVPPAVQEWVDTEFVVGISLLLLDHAHA